MRLTTRWRLPVDLVSGGVTIFLNNITNATLSSRNLVLKIKLGDFVIAVVISYVLRLLLEELLVTQDGFLGDTRKVRRRIEVLERKVNNFLRLHPSVVHEVEAFQVNNLLKVFISISFNAFKAFLPK